MVEKYCHYQKLLKRPNQHSLLMSGQYHIGDSASLLLRHDLVKQCIWLMTGWAVGYQEETLAGEIDGAQGFGCRKYINGYGFVPFCPERLDFVGVNLKVMSLLILITQHDVVLRNRAMLGADLLVAHALAAAAMD